MVTITQAGAAPVVTRARLDRTALADGEPLRFVASTPDVNRYGFALRTDGWRLANYNANPVVLWMHNPYRPPIGQGTAVLDAGALVLDRVTFDAEDEVARQVESKYRRGFLHAVSVSWDYQREDGTPVLDYWRLGTEEIRDELFYDLAEVSSVSVPGDPGALRAQRSRLAAIGRTLADLADERDHGEALAAVLAEAVRAELVRLGIDPARLTPGPPDPTVPPTPDPELDPAAVAALRSLTLSPPDPEGRPS